MDEATKEIALPLETFGGNFKFKFFYMPPLRSDTQRVLRPVARPGAAPYQAE